MSGARSILSDGARNVLVQYALANVLVALDYDGTLAPITARPEDARMRPRTRALLNDLAHRYPTVAISGRALADVSERLKSVPLWHVFGNHGMEGTPHLEQGAEQVRAWVDVLQRDLPADLGIGVEDKGLSLTLHTRHARDRQRAFAAIDAIVSRLPGVTVIGGKEVVNLLPEGGGNKGVALEYAMRTFVCSHAIYVGDDDTDEEAFAVVERLPVLGIRVGASATTQARFFVESQEQVDDLLEALVNERPANRAVRRTPLRWRPSASRR